MKNRKPDWLKIKVQSNSQLNGVAEMLKKLNLNTVCQEANCPNLMECFSNKTATFMILGRECTRNCTFCTVSKNSPLTVDDQEPSNVAEGVKKLGLKHVVITSVTRDDLPDGGAYHFVEVIKAVREISPNTAIEVLIPDFKGDKDALMKVVNAKPKVINHNIETIKRLYPQVRAMAEYERSLELLKRIKEMDPSIFSKSGLMVGLGETKEEVFELLADLRKHECDIVTIGQYLAPSKKHHPVIEYITPEVFEIYKKKAEELGFQFVASGPLVRSSYHAGEAFN